MEPFTQSVPIQDNHIDASIEQRWAEQDREDALNRSTRHTGLCHDRITGDYAIWLRGRIVGFAATPTAGLARLQEEMIR